MTIARVFVAALVAASLGCGSEAPRPSSTAAPEITGRPIVLVTVDTLRRDRLGAYGSTRGLTPALDRFAETAARFTAAVTQVPLTLPAHATLFTGLHPARHGVRTNDGFRLAPDVPILSDALRTRGYATGAFIGGYPLQAASGLARGFDRYDDQFLKTAGRVERSADEVVDAALAWITSVSSAARPGILPSASSAASVSAPSAAFLAWLHLFDPHSPYTPPAPFAAAHRDTPYDGEVAYTDAALGRLFDRLRQLDLFAPSTIVVVADHGEALGEHGERTHGTFLYDATVHIPMLIKLPGGAEDPPLRRHATNASTIDTPVEIADLAPTLAALGGATLPAVNGQNLLPLIRGDAGDPDRPAYTESYYQHILLGWSPLRAVRTRQWKLIEAPRPELYDLDTDPGEQQNRIATRGALAAGLQKTLPPTTDDTSAPAPSTTTSEAAERLRSLGYVSGTTTATAATRGVDPKDRVDVWTAIEDGLDRATRHPEAARAAFTRALQHDPGNGLALKSIADLEFRAGKLREAADGYRRAIAAGFRHPDAFVNLASIAERQGRLDEARAVLLEAVQAANTDADAWNRLGLLDARRGDVEGARRAFTSAIAAAPDRAEPYYNLAIVERRAGNEALAQSRLQEAIARQSDYPEAHYELGTGYLLARDPQRALDAYRAALTARPDYAEALFGAARAALELGRTDEARRDYEHFIRVAPREYRQQVAAARDVLRRLNTRQ